MLSWIRRKLGLHVHEWGLWSTVQTSYKDTIWQDNIHFYGGDNHGEPPGAIGVRHHMWSQSRTCKLCGRQQSDVIHRETEYLTKEA
jgi:hypothetical protein